MTRDRYAERVQRKFEKEWEKEVRQWEESYAEIRVFRFFKWLFKPDYLKREHTRHWFIRDLCWSFFQKGLIFRIKDENREFTRRDKNLKKKSNNYEKEQIK